MSLKVAVVLVALAVAQTINGLPYGVPPQACQTMSPAGPAHAGGLENSPLPYDLLLSATNIKSSGGSVTFTIKSKGEDKISGIMVQARNSRGQPIGTFQVNDPKLKTIACSAQDDTVSHTNPEPVDAVSMTWTPSGNFKGAVEFRATIAATRTKFWVAQRVPQTVTVN